jgi:hypothetical protein
MKPIVIHAERYLEVDLQGQERIDHLLLQRVNGSILIQQLNDLNSSEVLIKLLTQNPQFQTT